MALEAGQKLAHYAIVEPIGKGREGLSGTRPEARTGRGLKVLPPELSTCEERRSSLEGETKSLAAFQSPQHRSRLLGRKRGQRPLHHDVRQSEP